jgi:phosphinothricin acetyltransferase
MIGSCPIAIERMTDQDWPPVAAIYEEGIATGDATFDRAAPSWEHWDREHLDTCRLVARVAGQIVAWAALSPVSRRPVYAGVVEVSLYVKAAARGHGVGKKMLTALIAESEREGLWTLQALIFPENAASLALHKQCGFRLVGYRERMGQMDGLWRDVVLMERRSKVVGI